MKYALIPITAFYEFIPQGDESENPQTLRLNQLELGKNYEIVITTIGGLYRYRIQDVIKVVGYFGTSPQVEFVYRKNQLITMAGEKTNDEQLQFAISKCAETFGAPILEYAVYPNMDPLPGHYTILLEYHKALAERHPEVVDCIQTHLCIANDSYRKAALDNRLERVEVLFLQPETFAFYRELQSYQNGTSQVKPVRVLDTVEKKRFFFSLLEEV